MVDRYANYAFGFLHPMKQPDAALVVLHHDLLPFHQPHELVVQRLLTANGRAFGGVPFCNSSRRCRPKRGAP